MSKRSQHDDAAQWVTLAKRGDQDAFRHLVEMYQGRIYALCYGMLQNREEALDVVQESFVKAWKSLKRFKEESSFYTWLYRIASNMCLDYLRKRARRGIHESLDVDLNDPHQTDKKMTRDVEDESADPVKPIDSANLGKAIQWAIRQLPSDQQTVIVLREIEGLSYSEIAKTMKIRVGTVMSRLFYARKKLQELLHEYRVQMR